MIHVYKQLPRLYFVISLLAIILQLYYLLTRVAQKGYNHESVYSPSPLHTYNQTMPYPFTSLQISYMFEIIGVIRFEINSIFQTSS